MSEGTKPKPFENTFLVIDMPDGEWAVPVSIIAQNRAACYADIDKVDISEALNDTVEFFEDDDYEIHDWAVNNMNWKDVSGRAIRVPGTHIEIDREEFWCDGKYDVRVIKNVSK